MPFSRQRLLHSVAEQLRSSEPPAPTYAPVPPVITPVVPSVSENGDSTVMLPSARNVVHWHSHVPCLGLIRMREPWSRPATVVSVESYTLLWNVRRSPFESPGLLISTTVSLVACSMTVTVVAAAAEPDRTYPATTALEATALATTSASFLRMSPPSLENAKSSPAGAAAANRPPGQSSGSGGSAFRRWTKASSSSSIAGSS